jgi:DNA repair protein RadC
MDLFDRPRERLMRLGTNALTNRELITILIGSGTPGRPATVIAETLLERSGGDLTRMARTSSAQIARTPGVGEATATRLVAALELGRRAAAAPQRAPGRIRGPEDVFKRLGPHLRDLPHEEFHALLLTTQHAVIREVLITRGILDASLIHPRELFREAIAESSGAVILVHNHPSGDPTPSAEDRTVTKQLAAAGRTVGIPVVDHVVIGDGRFVSLAEQGVLG